MVGEYQTNIGTKQDRQANHGVENVTIRSAYAFTSNTWTGKLYNTIYVFTEVAYIALYKSCYVTNEIDYILGIC